MYTAYYIKQEIFEVSRIVLEKKIDFEMEISSVLISPETPSAKLDAFYWILDKLNLG